MVLTTVKADWYHNIKFQENNKLNGYAAFKKTDDPSETVTKLVLNYFNNLRKYLNFVGILIQLHYPSEVSGGFRRPIDYQ